MNLYLPKFRPSGLILDRAWHSLKTLSQSIAGRVSHRAQVPVALDLARAVRQRVYTPEQAAGLAGGLFGAPLKGAGLGWESRRWLNPASDAAIATTGANTVNFNVYDFFSLTVIGFYWTVAGTVTAMVGDFDLYTRLFASTLLTDKLDGSNGVLSGGTFTLASQVAGAMWVKDLGTNIGEIDVSPGNSVQFIVTTTTTAGNGMPFVIGEPRAETFRNVSTAVLQTP